MIKAALNHFIEKRLMRAKGLPHGAFLSGCLFLNF